MMRVYSSLLMSSLLMSGTPVNAQSLDTRSTFFTQDSPAPEFLTALADTQSLYAEHDKDTDKDTVLADTQTLYAEHDKDTDKDTVPERGSGRTEKIDSCQLRIRGRMGK